MGLLRVVRVVLNNLLVVEVVEVVDSSQQVKYNLEALLADHIIRARMVELAENTVLITNTYYMLGWVVMTQQAVV